ncbi:type II secretion system minor pseudopilin GspK [Sphaerotilus sp.]|uniref:type II secretion system minor pseudopilin GspK n=1 Tax=Sphaerotilus sp. TaxID=2093942 RepID=UPI0034E24699
MTTTPMTRPCSPPARQRGAALLTAMIIVTVVATLASGMVWQQWRALQVEAAERAQTQSEWVLQGALDWTRMILREDAREGGVDHLGEPWAAPLAEARLSTFLAADRSMAEEAPDAFLSGRIVDAQSRYNLRNLVQQGKVSRPELQTLERLCGFLGLNGDVAPRLAEALRRATPGSATEAPSDAGTTTDTLPLMPASVEDLGWLGLDAATVRRLKPYVVLLPRETPVNLNTAAKEVIAAVLPGIDLATAERLVQARLRDPLKSPADAKTVLGERALTDARRVSVNSNYFIVYGALRLDQVTVAQRSLLERNGRDVRTLSTQRLRDLTELESSLQQ